MLSFVLFPKPVSSKHALGGLAVLVCLAAMQELQRRKGGDVKEKEDMEGEASKQQARLVDSILS